MINDISDGRVAFPALLTFISYIQFITFPISQSHVLNVHSCFNFRSPPLMASMILVEKRYHEVKHVKDCANMKTQTQKASCCIYERLGLRARCKCHHFSNYLCENWTPRPNLKKYATENYWSTTQNRVQNISPEETWIGLQSNGLHVPPRFSGYPNNSYLARPQLGRSVLQSWPQMN